MSVPGNGDPSSQSVACDRCRGQKLRCVWELNSRVCKRCTRAKADCLVSPPKPTGRPRKACAGLPGRDITGLSDGNKVPVAGGHTTAVYDYGISSCDWWPIPEDVDELLTELPLGHVSADGPPYIRLGDCEEPEEAGEPNHGLNIGGGFVELAFDADSSATDTAPRRVDISPPSSCQDAVSSGSMKRLEAVWECITQLCELNRALCQHHAPGAATQLRVGDGNQTPPHHLVAYECLNNETEDMDSFDLSTLQIGQLLSLTSQLGTINARLDIQGSGTRVQGCGMRVQTPRGKRRSMASDEAYGSALEQAAHHLAVGCYYRLEFIFSHVLKTLQRARNGPWLLSTSSLLQTGTPLLSIDGFALDGDRNMQLDLAMRACEQILLTTRRSVLPREP